MRGITVVLTFTVLLCGSSIESSTDGLPNVGLFVFEASPVTTSAPMIVGSR